MKAEGKTLAEGAKHIDAPPLDIALVETIGLQAVPEGASLIHISLTLADAKGNLLSRYEREVFLKAWRLQDELFRKG